MKIVDSHCHLDFDKFDKDFADVIGRAKKSGVSKILTICTKKNQLIKNIDICNRNKFIFFAYGMHPLNIGKEEIKISEIEKISNNNKMIAIGETGLDYFYNKDNITLQKKSFIDHMEQILKTEYLKQPFSAVMHCFSSGQSLANTAIELGFYLSMSGIITFPKSANLRNIFSTVPIDKILVETDSPYLSPVPFRGKRNEPSFILNTAKVGASIFSMSIKRFS